LEKRMGRKGACPLARLVDGRGVLQQTATPFARQCFTN
jgi:hypothetical protein